jgi:hypothetical protein
VKHWSEICLNSFSQPELSFRPNTRLIRWKKETVEEFPFSLLLRSNYTVRFALGARGWLLVHPRAARPLMEGRKTSKLRAIIDIKTRIFREKQYWHARQVKNVDSRETLNQNRRRPERHFTPVQRGRVKNVESHAGSSKEIVSGVVESHFPGQERNQIKSDYVILSSINLIAIGEQNSQPESPTRV